MLGANGDSALLREQPPPWAWAAAITSANGLTSGFSAAVAVAVLGCGLYIVQAIMLHDYMASASWGLLAGLTAISLARLLAGLADSGASESFAGLVTSAAPAILKGEATVLAAQRKIALAVCAGGVLSFIAAIGWLAAGEVGAGLWALVAAPMAFGCAAASVTPLGSSSEQGGRKAGLQRAAGRAARAAVRASVPGPTFSCCCLAATTPSSWACSSTRPRSVCPASSSMIVLPESWRVRLQ